VVAVGDRRVAIGVDRLDGTSTVVVRPIPDVAEADTLIGGAALDTHGVPQLVLAVEALIEAALVPRPVAREVERTRTSVLVVDDSLTTRMLEKSILEAAGYDVDTAVSAELGLEAARRKAYALFLVDVEMPGMDGFTFVERIRADAALRDTPAILVTSRSSASDRMRGEQAGAQGYIVKSEFDQADLLARIQRLVRSHA
jgi:two-component system chemotaxis sensor kinase CheA